VERGVLKGLSIALLMAGGAALSLDAHAAELQGSWERLECGVWHVEASYPNPTDIAVLKNDRIVRVCNASNKTVVTVTVDNLDTHSLPGLKQCIDVEGQNVTVQFASGQTGEVMAEGFYCLPRQ